MRAIVASGAGPRLACRVASHGDKNMLTLCGVPISNYDNKVKLALLEKQVPFIEQRVETGSSERS
jgi:hypothetical protein